MKVLIVVNTVLVLSVAATCGATAEFFVASRGRKQRTSGLGHALRHTDLSTAGPMGAPRRTGRFAVRAATLP